MPDTRNGSGADICTARGSLADLPIETRLAPIGEIDSKARTVSLVWSTGARVKRARYNYRTDEVEYYMEELSMEPGHVRMGRLQGGAPLLNTHNQWSLDAVLGVVESASLSRGEGSAIVRFSERADVEPYFRDVVAKIIRNVSVGYARYKVEKLPPDERSEGLPIHRAVDWEPMELSMVPIGADAGAGTRAGRSTDARSYPCEFIETAEPSSAHPQERAMPTATASENRDVRELIEENFGAQGLKLYRTYRDDEARSRLISPTELDTIFLTADSMKEVRQRLLDALATFTERTDIRGGHIGGFSGEDAVSVRSLMVDVLVARFGGPAASDRAKPYMGMRILDFAKDALRAQRISLGSMSPNEIIERALHSTGDFPGLLVDTGNRFLRMAFKTYDGGVRQICRQSTAPDFRAKQKLLLGEFPELLKVPPGAEFTSGTMAEAKETYSVETFGRIFGITRPALVNDDLSAFVDMAGKIGRQAAQFVCAQLVAKLTANPTMADNVALFHANHGNLAGSGAAIDITTIGAGVAAMRLQKGLDGKTALDTAPRYLVVPAAKEVLAKQYVAQINATKSSEVNPFSGDLTVVVDPRLDAVSSVSWYLAADPGVIDTIEYSYLEGSEGPQMESRVGFTVDGVETKARLDFGCGVLDYRGLYKNPGA